MMMNLVIFYNNVFVIDFDEGNTPLACSYDDDDPSISFLYIS